MESWLVFIVLILFSIFNRTTSFSIFDFIQNLYTIIPVGGKSSLHFLIKFQKEQIPKTLDRDPVIPQLLATIIRVSWEPCSPANMNQLSDTSRALGRAWQLTQSVCGKKKALLKSLDKHEEILTQLKEALLITIQVICTVFLQQKSKDPAKLINSSYHARDSCNSTL